MSIVSFMPQGRAGNFLFECAAAWAYAKKHGLEFSVPKFTNSDFHCPIYLHHLQHPDYNPQAPRIVVKEQNFHYNEIPFEESWTGQNILLYGYFQSYKYYQEYREEMLDAFNLHWKLIPDTCSIHARYGDYLTIPGKHIIVDEPYLLSAMEIIKAETGIVKFKIFSDDLNLFKQRHGHLYDFEYSTNTDIMADLIDASCCHSNIGSSSTFSYWISELNRNPDKIKTTQKLWFQEGWSESGLPYNTDDLLDDKWIKL